MIVIATGFVPLSPLSVVSKMVLLERIFFVVLVQRIPGMHA
jgi:hypothetical protein